MNGGIIQIVSLARHDLKKDFATYSRCVNLVKGIAGNNTVTMPVKMRFGAIIDLEYRDTKNVVAKKQYRLQIGNLH